MTDSEKQAAFVASLRKLAEDAAAKNPTLADMRALAKTLVAEARTTIASGNPFSSLGACMGTDGETSIVRPNEAGAVQTNAEILLKLRGLAKAGAIRAAAICELVDKPIIPGGSVGRLIQVHTEHVTGKAFVSATPLDEAELLAGVPGVTGPALQLSGGATQSKIFPAAGGAL